MAREEDERRRDLELTCACASGDPSAHAVLKQRYDKLLVSIARRLGIEEPVIPDVVQQVWIRLLVPVPPDGARIGTYNGKGSLNIWLSVVMTRATIDALRAQSQPGEALDDGLEGILTSPSADPEVEYLKRLYSAEFRDAFRAALAALTVRERNLLRQYFGLQRSIDRVGAMYGMHRTTALRQIQRARDALVVATRTELAARLQISVESVESIIRLIESRIDVDLASL